MDLENSLRRKPVKQRPRSGRGATYTMQKKIAVVTQVMALGNIRLVADLEKISYNTIREWRTQPWWKDVEAEVKAAQKAQVDSKLTRIINKALDTMEDRLEKGDFVWNQKSGEISRKPVSLKEARGAANDLMQRQAVIEKLQNEHVAATQQQTMADQLAFLANEFAKFQTGRTVEVVATEVSPKGITNAVHEEREARLQTGERAVQQPAGASEGEDGEESSTERSEESWD